MNDNLPPGIDLVLHQGRSLTLRRVLPDDAPATDGEDVYQRVYAAI